MYQQEFLSNFTLPDSTPSNLNPLFRLSGPIQFGCDAKEIKYGPILTTLPCPISNGDEAFKFANLSLSSTRDQNYAQFYLGFPVITAFAFVFLVLSMFFIHCNYSPVMKMKRKI